MRLQIVRLVPSAVLQFRISYMQLYEGYAIHGKIKIPISTKLVGNIENKYIINSVVGFQNRDTAIIHSVVSQERVEWTHRAGIWVP